VVRSQESEVAQGWDDNGPPVVLDYYGEEVPQEDLEDTMSEEEWLEFYDKNLAQSTD
jgi:hypothetical protein